MASMALQYSRSSNVRRAAPRYPIRAELYYRVIYGYEVLGTGRGRSLNISSSGILIEADHTLPPGSLIELSIAWPVRLHNVTALQLWVTARVVRTEGYRTALR